jgi:phosphoribosylglycinamide formyltransferase 1
MHSIIIFASGAGSNAKAIINYFRHTGNVKIALIVSNKTDAGVLGIAAEEEIPAVIIDKQQFHSEEFKDTLKSHSPSLIVLAGFLWKIPDNIVAEFPHTIINIHPALLPKYGGKGMYGMNVHEAVITAGEQESGITIHYVNEVYDSGNILLQARCIVTNTDTATSLAQKIHRLEYYFFPRSIEYLLGELYPNLD